MNALQDLVLANVILPNVITSKLALPALVPSTISDMIVSFGSPSFFFLSEEAFGFSCGLEIKGLGFRDQGLGFRVSG